MSQSALLEQAEVEGGSSSLSEARVMERQQSSGIKRDCSEAGNDSKRRESSLSGARPAKRQKNSNERKKVTFIEENDSLSIASNELEFEIERAKFEIYNRFKNMKNKMVNDDKMMTREMKIWTRGGLGNISGGKSPQNEIFIKSLIDNFEEIIRNIGQESRRDVNRTMDDIRKILVKLVNEIELGFRPRPCIEAVKVTRKDASIFLWICLFSTIAVLIGVFPDYLLKFVESAVAFYQSTILMFFLFCILYFYNPPNK